MNTFTVQIINTVKDEYSGTVLKNGQRFEAMLASNGCYHVWVNGEWVTINADNASVIH